jgi:hypothetical protein
VNICQATTCGGVDTINDFSSKSQMGQHGWEFDWNDQKVFKPERTRYKQGVASGSYWGFKAGGGIGTISLNLVGSGDLTLDFGNSWDGSKALVSVYLNGALKASAAKSTPSKTVTFSFSNNDVLTIVEDPVAVIVINSIDFQCKACGHSHHLHVNKCRNN